jgi:Arc/MetJ-type ribon-helix-helix transcriptional regulator
MAKAKSVTRKRKERPATGESPVKAVRLPPDLAERIERWAKANGKESHSEAMRHLLELGLSTPKRKSSAPKRKSSK